MEWWANRANRAMKRHAFDLMNAASIAAGESVRIVAPTPELAEDARQRALALLDEMDKGATHGAEPTPEPEE